jgi:hypothetical protein
VSIPPESIEEGKCYLSEAGKVRRVLCILPDQRVHCRWRNAANTMKNAWRKEESIMLLAEFAQSTERPVSCDGSLEGDEPGDAGRA